MTNIFIVQTGCGKSHLVLELIEKEYNKHFDYIIIICPTLQENSTYHAKEWIKNDDKVQLVEPKDNLYQGIKRLSELLPFIEVLLIIDNIIANERLDKRRQALRVIYLRQASGSLFVVADTVLFCHTKKLLKPAKAIFVWFPKETADLTAIYDENDVLTDDELVVTRNFLRESRYGSLYIQNKLFSWI